MVNKAIAWIVAAVLLVISTYLLGGDVPMIGSVGVTDAEWFWTIVTLMIMGGGAASGDLMGNIMDGAKGMMPHLLWFFVASVVFTLLSGFMPGGGGMGDPMAMVEGGLNAVFTGLMTSLWWSSIRSGL